MKTFQENREFLLGLIGEEWTRSTAILKQGEPRTLGRHLKAALRDELLVVNRVSHSEVYYKKNPSEVELNLMRLLKCARELMAEVQEFEGGWIEKLRERMKKDVVSEDAEGQLVKTGMTMADVTEELDKHGPERAQTAKFNECLFYLQSAMGVPPSEGWWSSKRAFVRQEEIHDFQAEGYELQPMRQDKRLLMEKK